jgi:F-type H+-transporting ATPase subunit b
VKAIKKSITLMGTSVVFVAASAVAAYASEEAEAAAEGGGGGASALIPKMAEFIPAMLAFFVVYLVLSKFAWPAISGMLELRAETIRESLEKAEAAKIEAERLLAEYKEAMAEARREAATILAQAKQAAEATRLDAAARAQVEYDALLVKAREAITGEKNAAIAELQASVARMSVAVAGKLIGSELSTEDHLKVVEKYVNEAGSLNEN